MQEIRTEHLTVGYDKTPLIGDVNLSVRRSEERRVGERV